MKEVADVGSVTPFVLPWSTSTEIEDKESPFMNIFKPM